MVSFFNCPCVRGVIFATMRYINWYLRYTNLAWQARKFVAVCDV